MNPQLKKGLIEYLVLATLNISDSYGYELVKQISEFEPITESTLYPILKRLELQEKVKTYSKEHNSRLRKYYSITKKGKKSLKEFLYDWEQLARIRNFIANSVD